MTKLLIANRGEIAIRILRAATELGWKTVAVYTSDDASHAGFADEAVKLANAADFMNIELIVKTAIDSECTHVHPGYGFLSETPALPLALAEKTAKTSRPIVFIGPSPDVLRIASDKMLSRELATSLKVPIAPGIRVSSADSVREFASRHGVAYPVMIKALDGGGGRGIRVVTSEGSVDEAFKRCLGESPSRQVFVEKALMGKGWKHIEVQVVGDGSGAVNHLWERECSVQRRFQKIVEVAPSLLLRSAIQPLLDASLRIARHLKYKGLGTFEYLIDVKTRSWVFLEINPRVQVEHTITEEINDIDLIRSQLLLFSSAPSLASLGLTRSPPDPRAYAIQLRLTAEDPRRGFQLSPGTISVEDVVWPQGRGIRVDTWLSVGPNVPLEEQPEVLWSVGTDFDSLLAKVIVRGGSFEEMTEKAKRALRELRVGGFKSKVKTNASVLAGVLDHVDWASNNIDTLWLERKLDEVLQLGEEAIGDAAVERRALIGLDFAKKLPESSKSYSGAGSATTMIQPGTLFHLTLSPTPETKPTKTESQKHTLTLSTINTNAFPDKLSGTLLSSFSSSSTPMAFELTKSTSAAVSSSEFELANPNDPNHMAAPLTGKVVELHPALAGLSGAGTETRGIEVKKGETLLVLSVMKMENAVVAPRDGYVLRTGKGVKVGVLLGEGMLVCVFGEGAMVSRL